MRKFGILLGLLLSASVSHADLMTLANGKSEKEGVNISVGATVDLNGASYSLTTVGSGVRRKKVVVVPIKVYVAQLLVSDAAQFDKSESGVLGSFDRLSSAAIHLTFLRDVPAEKIRESFIEGLQANQIAVDSPDMKGFIEAVEKVGAAEEGAQYGLFVARLADGQEILAIENKGRETVSAIYTGPAGMMKKIMSIWLGVPADAYLAELKTELLN